MKSFAQLFLQLDQTNKTTEKVAALKQYFERVSDADKVWTIALFTSRKPKRVVKTTQLRQWSAELANLPDWLFDEAYNVVGDLAETISLLIPDSSSTEDKTLSEWMGFLSALSPLDELERKNAIINSWHKMTQQERFVFTKLITGGFRVGVSQNLLIKAIADLYQIESAKITHRLMGNWDPYFITFQKLILEEDLNEDLSRPYPFCLAHSLDKKSDEIGELADWIVEWKWDGIRAQLIKRKDMFYIWSRGEELVTDKYPELHPLLNSIPNGTVLDGEIIPFKDGVPLPFGILQTRIGRKSVSKKLLQDAPVAFMAYDLLEFEGEDFRAETTEIRRKHLEQLDAQLEEHYQWNLSKPVPASNWDSLSELHKKSREYMAEGFMLKHKNSSYHTGRKRGDWWKWKIAPLTIDGVLLYAQKGHGRRANLYTDYTLAVWDNDQLVPFAKAYSGLTDAEIRKVDQYVKKNTLEKFGPVRTVTPALVFEIGFEGIQESKRHKSGIALRFPRILRWRHDKKVTEANKLADLQELLDQYGK
ncbi:ATP-dependent DNA ligase [Fulvivirgaceae bacterium LMO-SS25]